MPSNLKQAISNLRMERLWLNTAIKDLKAAKYTLISKIKQSLFTFEYNRRLAEYQKNISIINDAKLSDDFKAYQKFHTLYEQGELTGDTLVKYNELSPLFSAYRLAIENADVLLVKQECTAEIAQIDKCSRIIIVHVRKYKALKLNASVVLQKMAEKVGCMDENMDEIMGVLDMYVAIGNSIFSSKVSNLRALSKENIERMAAIKFSGILGTYSLMQILKANCICQLNEIYIEDDRRLETIKSLTLTPWIINLCRYYNTDMTKVQTIDDLEGIFDIINGALINRVLVINLAAIRHGCLSAKVISSHVADKFIHALTSHFHINKEKANFLYPLPVDQNGSRMSTPAMFEIIKSNVIRIQQDHQEGQPLYVPMSEALFTEDESGIARWITEEQFRLDNELLKMEVFE